MRRETASDVVMRRFVDYIVIDTRRKKIAVLVLAELTFDRARLTWPVFSPLLGSYSSRFLPAIEVAILMPILAGILIAITCILVHDIPYALVQVQPAPLADWKDGPRRPSTASATSFHHLHTILQSEFRYLPRMSPQPTRTRYIGRLHCDDNLAAGVYRLGKPIFQGIAVYSQACMESVDSW